MTGQDAAKRFARDFFMQWGVDDLPALTDDQQNLVERWLSNLLDAAVADAVKEWKKAAATETPSGLATRIADLEANIRRRNRD